MPKLKILFVSANPIPAAFLKVDAEYKAVRRKLRGRTSCDIRLSPSATLEDLIDEIKNYKPNMVHFSAHGSLAEEIVLNDEDGKAKPVPTKALEQLFKTIKGDVRLVVMNSCFSARQAKAIAKFVDCVVGVKLRFVDDTAIKFSPRFYETLAEGESVAVAYDTAMISVYGERPEKQQVPRLFKGRVEPEKISFLRALKAQTKTSPPLAKTKSALRGKADKPQKTVDRVDLRASAAGASATPAPVAPTISGASCQSLHWDVKIDEEGDAYNEMTYKGIVLPPGAPYIFALPPAEVQSGHTTEYRLIWDDRTTEGASLKRGEVSSTKIEMNVEFTNHPTGNNPARFAVRCWDWNVYSMNMEEYRQKPRWSEDGLDYAEKQVPEPWQNFTLLIQFPPQMVFAKRPFFEIYNPSSSSDEARNDELTAAYQHCFYYSSALDQAVLFVERPPSPFSYRVSWRLGESPVRVASALSALQRQQQRTFARRLLHMRRTLEADEGGKMTEAKLLDEGVNSVLASLAEHVQRMLGGAELDPASLEISLMVLDEDQPEQPAMDVRKFPVLRIVAGTLLRDPEYRALAFFVGDGNAGRAWKRRMARVFDSNEADPKFHVYVPIPGSPGHRFLVSVPLVDPNSDALIYGILNFGTFTDDQAELLRKIGTAQEVQSMTSFAQSYVLKRLKELLTI